MVLSPTTLRPGYLVSLKTIITGNVKYDKQVIESEHLTKDGKQKARWETERTIFDPEEHEASAQARGKARSLITAVCAQSAFGLLCPEDRADALEQAIADARKVANEFNNNAKLSRLSVYVITGKIAQNDAEAVRAINSEVRDLLATMEQGVKNLDVEAIRGAANKAKNLGSMLTDSAKENIQAAIDVARKAARQIVKAGEGAAVEVDTAVMRKIASQRTMFLDLDDAGEVAAPEAQARAIELEPSTEDIAEAEAQTIAENNAATASYEEIIKTPIVRVPRLELD